nr:MAG TPA: hypothetical protein [Caudoviricetes sp.]
MYYYPNFAVDPVVSRTTADINEVKAYLNGSSITEDLYGQTDDLYDSESNDLVSTRSPYRYYGALNYTDLNRIEYNYMEVAKALSSWGYPTRPLWQVADCSMCSEAYPWEMTSLPYKSIIDQIRDNAQLIKNNFLIAYPKAVEYSNSPNYEDINTLEDIALQARETLYRIRDSAPTCNEEMLICGGEYV